MSISNPQVVRFCNDETRVAADLIVSAVRTLRQHVADYAAKGIGPLVAGSTQLQQDTVADNSNIDGRTPLLGYDVDLFNGQCIALLAHIDAQPGMLAALAKPGVNTKPAF